MVLIGRATCKDYLHNFFACKQFALVAHLGPDLGLTVTEPLFELDCPLRRRYNSSLRCICWNVIQPGIIGTQYVARRKVSTVETAVPLPMP